MLVFVILGLLICTKAPGASSGTPVFVQTGKDLSLDVKERFTLGEGDDFRWRFNYNMNIGKMYFDSNPILIGNYKQRAELFLQNHTLRLKNVQKSDSGLYTALVIGDQDKVVAQHEVTVQDPVSSVKLRVDSVSRISDSCNVTVTCSTQDSHLSSTFRCDTKTCSQEGGERSEVTTSGASVHVDLVNGSVICNHSNQVSETKDMTNIQHFCPRDTGSECVSAGISVCLVKTVVFSVGLIIMVSAVICVHIMEKRKKEK